jgi:hypothetical protein
MITLIAPKDKVLLWLDVQETRWRELGRLPIATPAEWKHTTGEMHRAYMVLFAGIKRAFTTTEQEELNVNHVLMRSAYVGELDGQRSKAREVYLAGMLAVIAEARVAAQARTHDPGSWPEL